VTSASAEVLTGLFSLAFVAMVTPGPNNLVAMSLSVSGNALRAVAAGIVLLLAGLGVLSLGKLAKSCYLPEDEPLCS